MSKAVRHIGFLSACCALVLLAACELDTDTGDDGGASNTDAGAMDASQPDAGPSPLLDAPEATEVGSLELDEPVSEVVYVADLVLGLHTESDVSILDVSDATTPRVLARLPTTGRAISVAFDVELRVLFILTAQGDLRAYRVADVTTPAQVVQQTITEPGAADDSTLRGMARVGNRLFLLGASNMIPVQILYGAGGSIGFLADEAVALDGEPERIANGGDSVFIAFRGGLVQVWSSASTPAILDSAQLGASITGWFVRGRRIFVALQGLGVRVVDLSIPGSVQRLYDARDLNDATALKRFGNLVLIALARGSIVALDLSDITAPRPLVTRSGSLPDWIAPAGGNLILGSGTQLSVLGIPPFVNSSVPRAVRRAFPRYGRIPLTLSKPVDLATVIEGNVVLRCGDTVIEGSVSVSPDGLRITFLPSAPLPAAASCTLSLDGVQDRLGLDLTSVQSALEFETVSEEPAPIENPKSSYPHTADGEMTDWVKDTTEDYEYSDITPAIGMYSRFYADHDGERLWMLNDWFYNSDDIDPDCYNQFGVWTGNGTEQWQIRAYGDQRIEVWLNGTKLAADDARVTGGYGHVATPNDDKLHTVYEIAISTQPGSWGVQLHDPGPSFGCEQLETDPTTYNGASTDTGSSIDPTLMPTQPSAPSLRDSSVLTTDVTLSWTTQDASTNFTVYLVEIGSGDDLSNVIYRVWVYGTRFELPAGLLRVSGTYTWRVTAYNVAGTRVSEPVTFTVGDDNTPVEIVAPVLSSADPSSIEQGANAAITITGTGFVEGAVATWSGTALSTTYVSSTQLTVMVPASLTEQAGTYALIVRNDADDADTASNDLKIAVTEPQQSGTPTITSIDPSMITQNEGATLTVTGTGFVDGAVVNFSSSALTTTFVSSTQLTATLPSEFTSVTGARNVLVMNPGPAWSAAYEVQIVEPAACVHNECLPGDRLGSSCSFCATGVCGSMPSCCTTEWTAECVAVAQSHGNCGCASPSLSSIDPTSGTSGGDTSLNAVIANGSDAVTYQLVLTPDAGGSETLATCTYSTGSCSATVPGALAAGVYDVKLRITGGSVTPQTYDTNTLDQGYTQNAPAGLECFSGGNAADPSGAGTCADPFVLQLIGNQIGTTLVYSGTGGGAGATFGSDNTSCSWSAHAHRVFQVQLPDGAAGFDVSVDPIGSPTPYANPRIAALEDSSCTQPPVCVDDGAADACEVARFTTAAGHYFGSSPYFVVGFDEDNPAVELVVRVRAF